MSECRRCSECADSSHHWIDTWTDAGNDYACKHCPAEGRMCDRCLGDGCDHCGGEGVIEVQT